MDAAGLASPVLVRATIFCLVLCSPWLDTSADFPATPSEACQNRSGEDLGSGAPRFFNILLLRSSPKNSGAHECYGNQPESEYNEQNNDGRLK